MCVSRRRHGFRDEPLGGSLKKALFSDPQNSAAPYKKDPTRDELPIYRLSQSQRMTAVERRVGGLEKPLDDYFVGKFRLAAR